ncbi:MAG: glycosyltransferase [Coriobacteriia bacterium]
MDFAVYGLFDFDCGLRIAADNTVRALEMAGHRVERRSIQPDGGIGLSGTKGITPQVNLFHANPNWVSLTLSKMGEAELSARDRLNVLVPFWELPVLPPEWIPLLDGMDLVLAPTPFIADAVSASVPDSTVDGIPQAVYVPDGIRGDRERFGIPFDAFAFVMSFDADSSVHRKNPWAAVDAFIRAFPEDPRACLVVRTHATGGEAGGLLAELLAAAGGDRRIRLITGSMDYRDILALYASCDVYVSLHRSEGLGLGPMEAMSLGRVVIATGWSGNMDYMTAENSLPVECDLVPVVVPPDSPYADVARSEGVSWAEPRIEHAAELMRRIRDDEQLRTRLSGRAAADMETRRMLATRTTFMTKIESQLSAMTADGAADAHLERAQKLEALRAAMVASASGTPETSKTPRSLRRVLRRITDWLR